MKKTIVLLTLLLLAACSPAHGPSVASAGGGPSVSASPSADKAEANRRFAKCMREHGVDVPDPGPDGNLTIATGADRSKVLEASEACQEFLPNGGALKNLSPEQLEQARAFAKCMREHGVNMPDPDPNTGLSSFLKSDIDVNSPAFKAAAEACKGTVGR
ncbi:hypothetical protein KZZ52_57970 [Dactylosporangium sp. AC04546]|uniref:hypothetical protein n=1 Tax=Dactylosporangium sp. AC04546 TaxID=2862460 RepID=UPI001EDFDD44|nr:hypothetical protein [Dactylosporangium sp. AC04546]WVK83492.1 hypothetical protein KZZ52_57970 [Dactylosporangium sp. AC04546]